MDKFRKSFSSNSNYKGRSDDREPLIKKDEKPANMHSNQYNNKSFSMGRSSDVSYYKLKDEKKESNKHASSYSFKKK